MGHSGETLSSRKAKNLFGRGSGQREEGRADKEIVPNRAKKRPAKGRRFGEEGKKGCSCSSMQKKRSSKTLGGGTREKAARSKKKNRKKRKERVIARELITISRKQMGKGTEGKG